MSSLAKLIKSRGGVKPSLSIAGATFAILTLSSAAHAATVVLDFTDNTGTANTFQETAGTATATFSNPSPVDFSFFGGLVLGNDFPTSFDVSFDQDVELLSYISVLSDGTIDFDITGPGVSSLGNVQSSSDFVGQPLLFQGGETYTFTGNPISGNANWTIFGSWTINHAPVSQSVPEPSSILGLLSLGGFAIKKVAKNSKKK